MRHPYRITALLALALTPALVATQQETPPGKLLGGWALDRDGNIRIHNHEGSIRVVGWSRDSVAVRGTVAPKASFFGGGTRRGIKLGVEGQAGATGNSSDLVIQAPRWATIVIRGAATDVQFSDLIGSVDASTVNGSIRASADCRDLVAETMEGPLTVSGTIGVLRAKTASGRLAWTGRADEAVLGSVSGTVEVRGGPIGRARVETISGDVLVDAEIRPEAEITIESHSGSIEWRSTVTVPTLFRADAARVYGDYIETTTGFTATGKREPVRMLPFAGAREDAPSAAVTVRSFKGEFRMLSPVVPTAARKTP